MPSVIDTLEHVEHVEHVETHDLTIERPQIPRGARPGFWRTLAHGITTYLAYTPRTGHASSCRASRPYEAPMDQFIREYPSISILALAIT